MKKNFLFLGLVCLTFLFACKKDPAPAPLSSEKKLTEFWIGTELNPQYLKQSVSATITETEILMELPQVVDATKLIPEFKFVGKSIESGGQAQESGKKAYDFTKPLTFTVIAEDGTRKDYKVTVSIIPELKKGVPHIYITTNEGKPINSKKDYTASSLRIDGGGVYDDYEGTMGIRGRGNTTWEYPKKPYRIKLDKKASLLDFSAEKDWILLANYLDGTLMANAVAFKIARLYDMPFTNTAIPVDVTINGEYQGSYMFTEHKEVEENRINVGDDGVLLELDTYFDEPFKFYSDSYQLPVMLQHPELDKLDAGAAATRFAAIKSDFTRMEQTIFAENFPNAGHLNYIDGEALVRFILIYDMMLNEEINHPKSTYIYQLKGGKYKMGPVWDFDWALGFEGTGTYFSNVTKPLFWNKNSKGEVFFKRLMTDPAIRALYKKEFQWFKNNKLAQLHTFIDEYAAILKDSYNRDFAIWKRGSGNQERDVQKYHQWFNDRFAFIEGNVAGW